MTELARLPTALTDEANDFLSAMRVRQDAMLAACSDPPPAERVKCCKFCGSRWRGNRISRGYERSDGMWIEDCAQVCCGHPTPFRHGVTDESWEWRWVAAKGESEPPSP